MMEAEHIGRNLRHLRLLKGMKQAVFAKKMGVAQQNISKMENKREISKEKLEAAAKVLGTTVEAIESFNERVYLNNNIALEQHAGQIIHPIKEVIEYFKDELLKRDNKIEQLLKELEEFRSVKKKSPKPNKSDSSTNLRSVNNETGKRAVQ